MDRLVSSRPNQSVGWPSVFPAPPARRRYTFDADLFDWLVENGFFEATGSGKAAADLGVYEV
jgi:hypothetical protein